MKKIKTIACSMVCTFSLLLGCSGWNQGNAKSSNGKDNESITVKDEDLMGEVDWGLSGEGAHFYTINKNGHTPKAIPSLYLLEFHYQLRTRHWGDMGKRKIYRKYYNYKK